MTSSKLSGNLKFRPIRLGNREDNVIIELYACVVRCARGGSLVHSMYQVTAQKKTVTPLLDMHIQHNSFLLQRDDATSRRIVFR